MFFGRTGEEESIPLFSSEQVERLTEQLQQVLWCCYLRFDVIANFLVFIFRSRTVFNSLELWSDATSLDCLWVMLALMSKCYSCVGLINVTVPSQFLFLNFLILVGPNFFFHFVCFLFFYVCMLREQLWLVLMQIIKASVFCIFSKKWPFKK